MNPVPTDVPGTHETIYAADQPEYTPLPVIMVAIPIVNGAVPTPEGSLELQFSQVAGLLSRWRPTDEERKLIAEGGDIWVQMMTFGKPPMPLSITAECPIA